MALKPILFSGPMVRAILAGKKTQTRRVMKPQPDHVAKCGTPIMFKTMPVWDEGEFKEMAHVPGEPDKLFFDRVKPRYEVGDVLWVRETHLVGDASFFHDTDVPNEAAIAYRADGEDAGCTYISIPTEIWSQWARDNNVPNCLKKENWDKWLPSIHMHQWMSRISLEVTGVRCERLNEISEEDAEAEGVEIRDVLYADEPHGAYSYTEQFKALWNSINGKTHPWESNPHVWVYEFKRIQPTEVPADV